MTPQEKAKWLAEFYAAVAEGKTPQTYKSPTEWTDVAPDNCREMPTIGNDPNRWRIKPEPRRMWMRASEFTYSKEEASEWKTKGWTVTEWLEVV
jgi:hypothetical protein